MPPLNLSGPWLYRDPILLADCEELMKKGAAGSLGQQDFLRSQHRGFRLLAQHIDLNRLSAAQMGELASAFCLETPQ